MALFRRKNRTICGYWDCNKRIPDDAFLCAEHYEDWANGFLDQCPECGRLKDKMYRLCLDCYYGRRVTSWEPPPAMPVIKHQTKVEYSDSWVNGYMRSDRFFVYILEFNDGNFYVGHAKDLRKRVSEHRDPEKSSDAMRNPKLQYVQIVATQKAAELRETELKRLINSNPEQIRLMIYDFRGQMRQLGLDETGY